jgi:NAD(P)-dependent dehydrogenase (short-subunit alcohol dehydrogenase family)
LIGEIMPSPKRVALVTGGAKGIGRATVRHLISTGWHIGVVDLPDSGLRRAFAGERNVMAIEGNVRDEETASDAVEAIVHRFRRLDGVVSKAAS